MIELLKIAAVVIVLSACGVLAVWLQYHMEQQEIRVTKKDVLIWYERGLISKATYNEWLRLLKRR